MAKVTREDAVANLQQHREEIARARNEMEAVIGQQARPAMKRALQKEVEAMQLVIDSIDALYPPIVSSKEPTIVAGVAVKK